MRKTGTKCRRFLAHDSGGESQDEILDTDSDSDSDKENRQSSTTNSQNVAHFLSTVDVTRSVKEVINSG